MIEIEKNESKSIVFFKKTSSEMIFSQLAVALRVQPRTPDSESPVPSTCQWFPDYPQNQY